MEERPTIKAFLPGIVDVHLLPPEGLLFSNVGVGLRQDDKLVLDQLNV